MGGVDREGVDAHFDHSGGALQKISGGSNGSRNAEAALGVLAGVGVLEFFWMSLTVMRPLSSYSSLTTRSFSTRC